MKVTRKNFRVNRASLNLINKALSLGLEDWYFSHLTRKERENLYVFGRWFFSHEDENSPECKAQYEALVKKYGSARRVYKDGKIYYVVDTNKDHVTYNEMYQNANSVFEKKKQRILDLLTHGYHEDAIFQCAELLNKKQKYKSIFSFSQGEKP